MKTINKELVGLLLFTTLFYILFWDQFWGLNILLLSIASGAIIFWFNPFAIVQRSVQLMLSANLLCAIGIFWHNSIFTHAIYIISFILLIGKSQFPFLTQLFFLGIAGILNYFICLFKAFKLISNKLTIIPGYKKYHHWIIVITLPIIISSVFLILYYNANESFNKLTFQFFDWTYKYLKSFIDLLSLPKFFFLLFGFGIGASLLLRFKNQLIEMVEKKLTDDIQRKSWNSYWGNSSLTGMKNYYRMAIISFLMVNILLLIVNILDITHVWFNFKPSGVAELRQFVHTGTYILIFSVFIAIGIVLYFFYGNINFYKHNRWVKILAYVWIGQNMIMVVSVLVRNLYYVQLYGLAYKRLGVFFFLIATILALVFLIIKVKERKSIAYYLRTISITAYCVLLFVALFNWDICIASYNLNYNRKNLDTKFLLHELSDKTLPILWKNKDAFGDRNGEDYQYLLKRIQRFQKRKQSDTWKSTTIMGMINYEFFLKNDVPKPDTEKQKSSVIQ
ncbi:MAG: DUF4173 domain-containing protein [Bacteroidetes bacterium]|nr:DUF4173 domain-containing protein [Bacteroidota bacterium]